MILSIILSAADLAEQIIFFAFDNDLFMQIMSHINNIDLRRFSLGPNAVKYASCRLNDEQTSAPLAYQNK